MTCRKNSPSLENSIQKFFTDKLKTFSTTSRMFTRHQRLLHGGAPAYG